MRRFVIALLVLAILISPVAAERIPIVLADSPNRVPWDGSGLTEKWLLDQGVVYAFGGHDELGPDAQTNWEWKIVTYPALPHIAPLKGNPPGMSINEDQWATMYPIYNDGFFHPGWFDEPLATRQGYDDTFGSVADWRKYVWGKLQGQIDMIQYAWPDFEVLVANPWPMPEGCQPLRDLDMAMFSVEYLAVASQVAIDQGSTMREVLNLEPTTPYGGYLVRFIPVADEPLNPGVDPFHNMGFCNSVAGAAGYQYADIDWCPTFRTDPKSICDWVEARGGSFFWYYWASDPELILNGEATNTFKQLMQVQTPFEIMRDRAQAIDGDLLVMADYNNYGNYYKNVFGWEPVYILQLEQGCDIFVDTLDRAETYIEANGG